MLRYPVFRGSEEVYFSIENNHRVKDSKITTCQSACRADGVTHPPGEIHVSQAIEIGTFRKLIVELAAPDT